MKKRNCVRPGRFRKWFKTKAPIEDCWRESEGKDSRDISKGFPQTCKNQDKEIGEVAAAASMPTEDFSTGNLTRLW